MYYYVGVYNMKREKYFETKWKCNRVPNNPKSPNAGGSCTVYCTITKEFEEILDGKYDKGSALITNIIKTIGNAKIQNVGRENNCVAITYINDESVWSMKDDELIKDTDKLFNTIIAYESAYPRAIPCNSDKIEPLYMSGSRYKPDAMFGMIKDVFIGYNRDSCIYKVSFDENVYKDLVCEHHMYFEYIMKDIMKCNNIGMHDDICVLEVVDENIGTGPTEDRANVIGLAAMFAVMNIAQIINLRG